MSKFTEALREVGICNPHELARDGSPFVWYHPREARVCRPKAWVLTVKGKPFTDRSWQNGDKWFTFSRKGDNAARLLEAIGEAERLCPGVKMVKGPWRCVWVAEGDLEAARAKARSSAKTPTMPGPFRAMLGPEPH